MKVFRIGKIANCLGIFLLLAFDHTPPKQLTISVDKDSATIFKNFFATRSALIQESAEVSFYSVSAHDLESISHLMHTLRGRCGGFMIEDSQSSPKDIFALRTLEAESFVAPTALADDEIEAILSKVSADKIHASIASLESFQNRYYRSSYGQDSQRLVAKQWQELSNDYPGAHVNEFSHRDWPQASIILTWPGTISPDEFLIVGGHGDSILSWNSSHDMRAPGADDNASGIAAITEIIRVLGAENFRPERSIQFMSYAAEEVGLRGSSEIAGLYRQQGRKVKGVIQLDMVNFSKRPEELILITDYTNSAQNAYLQSLSERFLPNLTVRQDRCGYACSDHASWNRNGYPVSFPFEARVSEYNRNIHSPHDTLAASNRHSQHAANYARLAIAYLLEMSRVPPKTQ